MWKLCVLALFVAYADAGVKDGFCVCEVSGRYQYRTFDDAFFRFDGLCSLQMTKTNPSAERQFTINVWNIFNGNVFSRCILMQIEGTSINILPGNEVAVNSKKVKLPYYYNEANISMKGNTLEVYLAWMLKILIDDKMKVTIKVPASFRGHLLGMCGDCNNNTADDFVTAGNTTVLTKSPAVEARIGESYADEETFQCIMKSVSDKCNASRQCFQMFDDPFKACRNKIGLQSVVNFVDSCKVDVCMGKQNWPDRCNALERLANECEKQKSPVKWKAFTGCENPCEKEPCSNNGKCVVNLMTGEYQCSCEKNFVGNNCETYDMCTDNSCGKNGDCKTINGKFKCTCNNGYLGEKCDKLDPCSSSPCKNGGTCERTYTAFNCICKLNYEGLYCQKPRDSCVCRVFGDPHYITFDGQPIHFMGPCKYTLTETKKWSNLQQFSVEVKNARRNTTTVSYTRFVDLKLNGNTFRLLPSSQLKVNGNLMILPLNNYTQVTAEYVVGWVILTTDFGLKIEFDGKHRVIVTVPSKYMGQLTGICGDCNLKKDDYKTKSGNDVSSSKNKSSLIGTSYQVVDDSDKPEANCAAVDFVMDCPKLQNDPCSNFFNDSMFNQCSQKIKVDLYIFLYSCQMDRCAHKNKKDAFIMGITCQVFESFTKECERFNIFRDWRTKYGCDKKCKSDEEYLFQTKTRQVNCFPYTVTQDSEHAEGCVCKFGFMLMGDVCLKEDQCGCRYKGMTFKVDENTLTSDCSVTVKCERNGKMTTLSGCAKNEKCLSQYSSRVCKCPSMFNTENNKCLVPAYPEEDITAALAKFVRVTMAYIEGRPLQKISTNRPGVCAEICRNNTECKSFNFDEMKDECKLFSVNAVNQTLVTVNCPFQDYYQLIGSEKIVIRGGTIFPCGPLTEYAVVKTFKDCKAKCDKNKCKSMEYSVVNQECSISKSTGKDFEIIGDSEFIFYGQLSANKPPSPYDG